MLKGKKLSILGDSISTYKDVSNDINANESLYPNPYFYRLPFPLEKTYWMLLIEKLGLSLCVNNSWSGGNLSGKDNSSSGLNRANFLSHNDKTVPDIIIIFMGTNDLGRKVAPQIFEEDYKSTLKTVKNKYPNAKVCCVNIPDRDIVMKPQTEIFNKIISDAVDEAGENFFLADLFRSKLNNDFYYMNTVDGLHPDEDGMRIIAEILEEAIKSNII